MSNKGNSVSLSSEDRKLKYPQSSAVDGNRRSDSSKHQQEHEHAGQDRLLRQRTVPFSSQSEDKTVLSSNQMKNYYDETESAVSPPLVNSQRSLVEVA